MKKLPWSTILLFRADSFLVEAIDVLLIKGRDALASFVILEYDRRYGSTVEWFSKRTGTSFENGARSKNAEKKLGRERRRVVLKSDLARETCGKFLF